MVQQKMPKDVIIAGSLAIGRELLPEAPFHISKYSAQDDDINTLMTIESDAYNVWHLDCYSSTNYVGSIQRARRAQGSLGSPENLQSGDIALIRWSGLGYVGGAYQESTLMSFYGNSDGNDLDGKVLFYTKEKSDASVVERMVIMPDGKVGIGTSDPDSQLHSYNLTAHNYFINETSDGWISLFTSNDGAHDHAFFYDNSHDFRMLASTTNIGGGTVESMRYRSDGTIGHVDHIFTMKDDSDVSYFSTYATGTGGYSPGWVSFFGSNKYHPAILWNNGNDLRFLANATTTKGGGVTEVMRLTDGARVGIGTGSPDTKLQIVGDCKFGDDNTNYATFATDGELTLAGTARVLKEVQLTAQSFAPGASGATATKVGCYPGFAFTINDDMVEEFEIPFDWDTSTDLTVKIYWYIDEAYATNNGEVQWKVDWAACPPDGTEAIDSPTHSGTIDFGDQNIPATAKYLTKTGSGTIAASSLSAGDLIGICVSRVSLDDGSNPTAEPVMAHFEIEYISNRLGEAT